MTILNVVTTAVVHFHTAGVEQSLAKNQPSAGCALISDLLSSAGRTNGNGRNFVYRDDESFSAGTPSSVPF